MTLEEALAKLQELRVDYKLLDECRIALAIVVRAEGNPNPVQRRHAMDEGLQRGANALDAWAEHQARRADLSDTDQRRADWRGHGDGPVFVGAEGEMIQAPDAPPESGATESQESNESDARG